MDLDLWSTQIVNVSYLKYDTTNFHTELTNSKKNACTGAGLNKLGANEPTSNLLVMPLSMAQY